MLCSSSLPAHCSPSEAELDPPRPVSLLWVFIGATENTRPYKDIIFYHELSNHNMDSRRKTNPLYTLHFIARQGWCVLYAGPPNEMTAVTKARWQRHMTARCHRQRVQMCHRSATRTQWHPLNPRRQRRGRAKLGVWGTRSVVLTTIPCTSIGGNTEG